MARRRRKSHVDFQEVSPSGWVVLVIGLVIASFFGGAVRLLLSDRQIDQWIATTLVRQNPPYELKFGSAQIQLADGIFPKFGLRVTNLQLNPKDPCRFRFQAKVRSLFLPASVKVLWGQKLRFGTIEAEDVEFKSLPACESQSQGSHPPVIESKDVLAAPIISDKTKELVQVRWPIELKRTAEWLDGVELKNFVMLDKDEASPLVRLDELSLQVNRDGGSARIRARGRVGGIWEDSVGHEPIVLNLDVTSTTLKAQAEEPLREGVIKASVMADFTRMAQSGKVELGFLAANHALEILRKWRVVTDPLDLKRSWLSGQIEWDGDFSAKPVSTVRVQNLALSGDSGEVRVEGVKIANRAGEWSFDPFAVQMKNLSLRYLMGGLGRKGYTGVISDFGLLTGELKVESDKAMAFGGELTGLELGFSRKSVRVKQRFDKIKGELALSGGRVSGLVSDFILKAGRLQGLASFNLDRELLNGVFQVKIEELQFAPEVQNLMTGGMLAPLALFGQGRMQMGEITNWSGEFGTNRIDGTDWMLAGLKAHSEFANHQMALRLKVDSAELGKGNPVGEKLRPVLSQVVKDDEAMRFQHLSVRLDVEPGGGRWRNGVAALVGNRAVAATYGTWGADGVTGDVSVDLPTAKMVRWRVLGPFLDLRIEPAASK